MRSLATNVCTEEIYIYIYIYILGYIALIVTRGKMLCFELLLRYAALVRSPVAEGFSISVWIGANPTSWGFWITNLGLEVNNGGGSRLADHTLPRNWLNCLSSLYRRSGLADPDSYWAVWPLGERLKHLSYSFSSIYLIYYWEIVIS